MNNDFILIDDYLDYCFSIETNNKDNLIKAWDNLKKEKVQEREQIRKAIDLLCSDNGWHDGIIILKKLLNNNYIDFLDGLKTIPINKIKLMKE